MSEAAAISAGELPIQRTRIQFAGLLVRIALSAAFLGAALWLSPVLPSWHDLSALSASGVAVAAALSFAVILLLAWRWRRLVMAALPGDVPPLTSFVRFTWGCLAVNQLMPSVVGGDALRITMLARAGARASSAAATVITDRVYGLVGLLLVCVATAPFLGPAVYLSMAQAWGLAGAALIGILLAAWLLVRRGYLSEELSGVVRRSIALRDAPTLLSAAIVAHLLNVAIFLAIAHALGVGVPLLTTTAVLSAVFLAGVLPISIAGWGVRELALVSVLGPLGGEHDKIVLASIVYGFFLLLTQALGFFMILRSKQW